MLRFTVLWIVNSLFSIKCELQIKRKSEGEETPKKRGGNRTKKTKQESSDEEDDCAAENCLRPSGKNDIAEMSLTCLNTLNSVYPTERSIIIISVVPTISTSST